MRALPLILLIFILFCFTAFGQSESKWYAFDTSCIYKGRLFTGRAFNAKTYATFLNDSCGHDTQDTPVKNEKEALSIAEPLLFKKFGEKMIRGEMPYEIYLIHGYWFLMGTVEGDRIGGTAHIIIKAKNGEMTYIWHEQ